MAVEGSWIGLEISRAALKPALLRCSTCAIRKVLAHTRPAASSRWPRLLLENPLHHAGADAELPADLEDAVATGLQF
jgi:hypothetical protein